MSERIRDTSAKSGDITANLVGVLERPSGRRSLRLDCLELEATRKRETANSENIEQHCRILVPA
jgi:hypothetical protein